MDKFSYFKNIFRLKFGGNIFIALLKPSFISKNVHRMTNVFFRRDIFKVFSPVVVAYSVFMVNLFSFRSISKESSSNKLMAGSAEGKPLAFKIKSEVAILGFGWFKNVRKMYFTVISKVKALKVTDSWVSFYSSYAAQIADFVRIFRPVYFKPIFHMLYFAIIITSCQLARASTVSFDQLAVSSDLTVLKWNSDMDRIYQKVNFGIDSSNVTDDTLAEADMADEINPRIRTYEGASCEKVYDGLLTTTTSGTLVGSVPAGTAYPRGYRVIKASATPKTFTASKWTFVDLDINGNFTYSEVAIDGATPSIATNSIRLSRVSTDGTQIIDVQDLRTTSCANGPFSNIGSSSGESNLDDVFRNGQKTRRFSPAGRTPNGFAQGFFVSWDTHTTFKVTAGSAFINGDYRSISTDITVPQTNDSPSTGVSGLDTGAIANSTAYYVYLVADLDAVKPPSVTFSTSSSAPAGVTNYRLIGRILTDATSLFTSKDIITTHGISERELVSAWITYNGSSNAVLDAYNVSSITDNGDGDHTITFDADFANAHMACSGIATGGAAGSDPMGINVEGTPSAGAINVETAVMQTGTRTDSTRVSVLCVGDSRR